MVFNKFAASQRSGFLALFVLGLIVSPLNAAELNQTTATYVDWTVRCSLDKSKKVKICEMVQSVRARGNKGILTQIAIGKPPGTKAIKMVLQVPTNIMIPNGVTMSFDAAQKINLQFLICTTNSCLAEHQLDADLLAKLRKSKKGSISFVMADKKTVKIPVSLKGFTDAFSEISN